MNRKLLAYLQLFRLPNVFSAIANVAMGFLVANRSPNPVGELTLLIVASCLLYTAGMVLNDLFDVEVDRKERPQRPLPSGRISMGTARALGFGLLAAGAGLPWLVGLKSGIVATLLAGCVLLYDGWAKQTFLGPLAMGSCRMLNVLLGMSVADVPVGLLGFEHYQWMIAAAIGIYVAGITVFAKAEAEQSDSRVLGLGFAIMAMGIALLAAYPWFTDLPIQLRGDLLWPTLLILLMISVVRRCVNAIAHPSPDRVQHAVKHSLFSLIVIDAAVVMSAVGPGPAIAVVALLVPSILLGKWIYST